VACSGEKKEESKKEGAEEKSKPSVKIDTLDFSKGMPVAYVNMDTLSLKYERIAEASRQYEEKFEARQKKLASMEQTLMADAAKFEKNAATMLKSEIEATQRKLQARQMRLQEEFNRLQQEMARDQENALVQNMKNLSEFLKEYCEENNIDMVFSYQMPGGQLLYSKQGYDITNDVVAGMNKKFRALLDGDKGE
jgi:outer membrane protein